MTTTGTTAPQYVARDANPRTARPGQTYFVVKVHSAQAVFAGSLWERVNRLIVTSQVALNHPSLGADPLRAIQRSREVRKDRAEQLGLSPNLVNLVPATMDRVSVSVEFILDKENRLAALGGLINDDAFLAAVSLAPGVALAARTLGALSQKILQTFLQPQERQPILQFSGDFNIATGDLRDGYYVLLGTRDERYPLPRPLPPLKVQDGDLFADGRPVTQWSYVVLDVRCLECRTRDLNDGAPWAAKLRQAEAVAQRLANDPLADAGERQRAQDECRDLLKEAQLLLLADANYLDGEARCIIKAAYAECSQQILGAGPQPVSKGLAQAPPGRSADRAWLGIPADEDLNAVRARYAEQVAAARRVISEAGIR
jgi:hypothetical protein